MLLHQYIGEILHGGIILALALHTVATFIILYGGTNSHWTEDALQFVHLGLYRFVGSKSEDDVQVKLINSKVNEYGYDLTDASARPTTFLSYCSIGNIKNTDPWCDNKTLIASTLMAIAMTSALASLIATILIVSNTKFPTWDGSGRDCTLPWGICLQFLQITTAGTAVYVYYLVHLEVDTDCKTAAIYVEGSTCTRIGTAPFIVGVDLVITFFSMIFWRKVNRWQLSQHSGHLTDGFVLAAKEEDLDVVLAAIANKIDINANGSDGRNALHWACALNQSTVCHILLKKGADISKKDTKGWTPLHWACRMGNGDIVRLLAKYGADIHARDTFGATPLTIAVMGESETAAQILLELGANVDNQNIFGQTALMLCAEQGPAARAFLVLLLTSGASVEITDTQGMNAIHYAAASGDRYVLETILASSSLEFCEKKNHFGDTPLMEALLRNKHRTFSLLKEWTTDVKLDTREAVPSENKAVDTATESSDGSTDESQSESSDSDSDD